MEPFGLFAFDQKTQLFSLAVPGFPGLKFSARAEVEAVDLGRFSWKLSRKRGREWLYAARNRWGTWKLRLRYAMTEPFQLEVSLECQLVRKASSVRLSPIQFQDFAASHLLTHGRKMGGCDGRL